ncbi:recombinase family protein [Eubacterium sp. AF15-50]|uniref:recombinase family protein n=1 Tax=Eubacterium sp. AF15-50 TaxID=2293103 RepID=UPI002672D1B2|nr:recombinase family protein [Eubacterium sp. AF15-50]
MNAAIYHFTTSTIDSCKAQIDLLKDFCISKGFTVAEIFCDTSLKRCERSEFDRFLSCCQQFDVLILKDFYHICKNTMKCISILKDLKKHNVSVITLENGCINLESLIVDRPLKVATYCSHYGLRNDNKSVVSLQTDVLNLFTERETNWSVIDTYYDESKIKNDSYQPQLAELIKNKDKYDIVLVHNLNDISWRTAHFCKLREQLKLDIYSLQDGLLKYSGGT